MVAAWIRADVQRELGGLADGPSEQQQRGHCQRPGGDPSALRQMGDLRDVGGSGGDGQDEDPEHERDVTDARGDERLDGGVGVLLLLPPVPDQQVGADAHDLPPDQQLVQVVGHDHIEHGRGEQGQRGEEERVPLVAVHVGRRVDLDQQRDGGDDDEHDRGKPVDERPDLNLEERTPVEIEHGPFDRLSPVHEVEQDDQRHQEARPDRRDPHRRAMARQPLTEQQDHEEGERGKGRDQPCEPDHRAVTTSSGSHRRR
jgi:hypothetical protein